MILFEFNESADEMLYTRSCKSMTLEFIVLNSSQYIINAYICCDCVDMI